MNTQTGQIYSPEQLAAGRIYEAPEISRMEYGELLKLRDGIAAGIIVPVSEEVVQKVRLGERELARRKRRQQRDSRRRNR